MKPTLREVLVESHISAITIAVLLLWAFDSVCRAIWGPLSWVVEYLFTSVAILGISFYQFSFTDRVMLFATFSYFLSALFSLAAAWLLAHWIYGEGPLRSLSRYSSRITGRNHA